MEGAIKTVGRWQPQKARAAEDCRSPKASPLALAFWSAASPLPLWIKPVRVTDSFNRVPAWTRACFDGRGQASSVRLGRKHLGRAPDDWDMPKNRWMLAVAGALLCAV